MSAAPGAEGGQVSTGRQEGGLLLGNVLKCVFQVPLPTMGSSLALAKRDQAGQASRASGGAKG